MNVLKLLFVSVASHWMAFMETSGRDHTTQHVDKAKPYKENPISQSSLGPVV